MLPVKTTLYSTLKRSLLCTENHVIIGIQVELLNYIYVFYPFVVLILNVSTHSNTHAFIIQVHNVLIDNLLGLFIISLRMHLKPDCLPFWF